MAQQQMQQQLMRLLVVVTASSQTRSCLMLVLMEKQQQGLAPPHIRVKMLAALLPGRCQKIWMTALLCRGMLQVKLLLLAGMAVAAPAQAVPVPVAQMTRLSSWRFSAVSSCQAWALLHLLLLEQLAPMSLPWLLAPAAWCCLLEALLGWLLAPCCKHWAA